MGSAALSSLLASRSVAVIGASPDPARIGGRPIASGQPRKFKGAILPVNPSRILIQGVPGFRGLASLPKVPFGDMAVAEVIGWMVEDAGTDMVVVHAAHGPVVVMTVGRSRFGAARSHTAAAVLAEFGALRARTIEEMLHLAQLATRRIHPVRTTLGRVTVGSGAGVLVSDAMEALGLPMPLAAQKRLVGLLPSAAVRNPLDLSLVGTVTEAMRRLGDKFVEQPGLPTPPAEPVEDPSASPAEAGGKAMLAAAGIQSPPERACADVQAAIAAAEAIGYPVVLKILSPEITHRTEIGGVLLDVADAAAVRDGFALLLARAAKKAPHARVQGVLVAKQLVGGVECILGIHQDPVFGPVAMVGLGGIFVEMVRDVAFRRCPFGADVAEKMIRSLRGAKLLLGTRGKPAVDVAALAQMLSRLSAFAHETGPRLQAVDLNPVLAMPSGAYAVDPVVQINA